MGLMWFGVVDDPGISTRDAGVINVGSLYALGIGLVRVPEELATKIQKVLHIEISCQERGYFV